MSSKSIKGQLATAYDDVRSIAALLNRRRPGAGDELLRQAALALEAVIDAATPVPSREVSGRGFGRNS